MSRNHKHSSNSSGICIYCNVFFSRLAAHMLSSESCMLASQESLMSKTMRYEHDNTSQSKNAINVAKGHITRSVSHKINMHSMCDQSLLNTASVASLSHNTMNVDGHIRDGKNYDNDDSSNYYVDSVVDEDDTKCNKEQSKLSSVDESSNACNTAIQIVPIDSDIFQRNFTPEEHFMINLCHVCDEANAPLDLVDKIVGVVRDAQCNGLNMQSNIIRSCEYFLKHLNDHFNTPLPETVHANIEDKDGNEHVFSMIWHNFLLQAMDLIHDHEIWGNVNNFTGTVPMDDPYNCFSHGRKDNKVDEVVDGFWYKQTVQECAQIANGERFVVLGLICYCDKTGTDVYQRNSLEPFSFTFCLFNRECRYKTSAWRTLGYIPDYDNILTTANSTSKGGFIAKSRSCRNFHSLLEVLFNPLIDSQGQKSPIYANVRFGDKVALCRVFFPVAYVMGDGLSSDKMCGRFLGYSNVSRISRVCNASYRDADNPECDCQRISMYYLQRKSNKALKLFGLKEFCANDTIPHCNTIKKLQRNVKEELSRMSHHMHNSAFRKVWFGRNLNGITSATPTDLMHAFCHGVLVYVIKIILAPLNNHEQS